MSENIDTKEKTGPTRERVVDSFRKFAAKGITHPDDLPSDDADVQNANRLLDEWTKQQKSEVEKKGVLEAHLNFNLSRNTIFVDAGFKNRDYLDEVANDWLAQDLQSAEDRGLVGIAKKIQDVMNMPNFHNWI